MEITDYEKIPLTQATVYASSSYSTSYTENLLIDNNESTFWMSSQALSQGKEWFAVDLGYKYKISYVHLVKRNMSADMSFKNLKVYGSNDSTNGSDGSWTELEFTIKENVQAYTNIEFTNPTEYKFVKFSGDTMIYSGNGRYFVSYNEINLYQAPKLNKILLLNMDSKVVGFENIDTPYITTMTSNTTPSPLKAYASSIAGSGYEAFRAFDGSTGQTNASWVTLNPYPTGWIALDFGEFRKVSKVKLTSWNKSSAKTHSPKNFLIEGSNDGSKWTTLKEIENETDWIANETREYSLGKTYNYKMYRINITKNNGAVQTGLGEIQFIRTDKFIKQLPTISKNNFINHGLDGTSISIFDVLFSSKNYILQDTVSEDTDGLWKTQITRKPLSISFN